MIRLATTIGIVLSVNDAWSFNLPDSRTYRDIVPLTRRVTHSAIAAPLFTRSSNIQHTAVAHTWSPQDLTKDSPGFEPIPDDDYVKKYQANPELWPVEFFVIAYRRVKNKNRQTETQILVRKSANGTSKWGLGTGVPATRWMLSSLPPPQGYQWSTPQLAFDASNFPEFDPNQDTWSYRKIDICEDAFHSTIEEEPELKEYSNKVWNELKKEIQELTDKENNALNLWESTRFSAIKAVVDKANCMAAIQGTLRMSGLFAQKSKDRRSRHVTFECIDPTQLVKSMRVYTMFPQMPSPLPPPSTLPEELQREIMTREARMTHSGRDPHQDRYGRIFTHISTANVSNTIHGIYFTVDLTNHLSGLDDVPPAFDLFGDKRIQREWKSLEDLKVLQSDGRTISIEDTKPTFISGFIVRQLVKEGIISITE